MLHSQARHTDRPLSDHGLWRKLTGFARAAGRDVVEKTLWLHYAAQRPDVPAWAKGCVYGALAYFILPTDAVPDLIPLGGYVDDLSVLAMALTTIAAYVDDEVKRRAEATLRSWFAAAPLRRRR